MSSHLIPCQCCGSEKVEFYFKRVFDKYSYYVCRSCRFVICDPLPTPKDIEDWYNSTGYVGGSVEPLRTFEGKQKLIEDDSEKIHADLKKLFPDLDPEKTKFLDAGGGAGFYSHAFARMGYKVDYLEIGGNACNEARLRYGGEFGIFEGDIMDHDREEEYDMIMSNQAIEHVVNPRDVAMKFNRLLKPGGILLVTTPNQFSGERYFKIYQLYRYLKMASTKRVPVASFFKFIRTPWACCDPPRHITSFNHKSMRRLLEGCGFECRNILTERGHCSYYSRRGIYVFQFNPRKPFASLFHMFGNSVPIIGTEIVRFVDLKNIWLNSLVAIAVKRGN